MTREEGILFAKTQAFDFYVEANESDDPTFIYKKITRLFIERHGDTTFLIILFLINNLIFF